MRDYHHTKFGLIWIKESKDSASQVENVLNRPGETGLITFLFPGLQAVSLCVKVEKALEGFSKQVFPEKQSGVLKLFHEFLGR